MNTQRVNNQSRLINTVVELKKGEKKIQVGFLPAGVTLVQANLEVIEPSDATALKLGVESNDALFIASHAPTAKGNAASDKVFTAQKGELITLGVTGSVTKGKVAVRVVYFTPSTYIEEY
jgi:hypothetical protein